MCKTDFGNNISLMRTEEKFSLIVWNEKDLQQKPGSDSIGNVK